MQHPDLTSQLARERQARYRAAAGRSRLARPDRGDEDHVTRASTTETGE
jgi:hypothetical protein